MKRSTLNGNDWFSNGQFAVGCNYWASHAGIRMWADWQPDVVKKDLRRLRQRGLQVLRVFPYSPNRLRETLEIAAGWNLKQVLYGKAMSDGRGLAVELGPNDACVLVVARPKR